MGGCSASFLGQGVCKLDPRGRPSAAVRGALLGGCAASFLEQDVCEPVNRRVADRIAAAQFGNVVPHYSYCLQVREYVTRELAQRLRPELEAAVAANDDGEAPCCPAMKLAG